MHNGNYELSAKEVQCRFSLSVPNAGSKEARQVVMSYEGD